MKKIKYVFIILLTFIVFLGKANALERTEDNNYGVNKKWEITDSNINYIKNTPYVDANLKIYDYSDILSDDEEKELLDKIKKLIKEYNMDIVILTYNLPYTEDKTNEDFATDFYDFNDFGLDFKSYSGVIIFRNTYEDDPYYDMYSFGEAQLYFNSSRMNEILDDIYYPIHNGDYLDGFNTWIQKLEYYHNMGPIKGYYVDENSYLRKKFNPLIIVNTVISSIVTLIYVTVNIKKNKMVMLATDASTYLNEESFNLLERSDRLVNSVVTSYTESDSYSSSGGFSGGSHSSSGHSGGGHSSGGGRHG